MHRTTLNLEDDLARRAKVKASAEGVTISEVVRELLARWTRGELDLGHPAASRQALIERARSTYGMWGDRDPDLFLAQSRASLHRRDRELKDARMGP